MCVTKALPGQASAGVGAHRQVPKYSTLQAETKKLVQQRTAMQEDWLLRKSGEMSASPA